MLVLSRKAGQEIVIGDDIRITVVAMRGDQVRLGIEAPQSVTVDRAEVRQRRMQFQDAAVCPTAMVSKQNERKVGETYQPGDSNWQV
jgi:carbon storage regulator